MQPKLPLEKMVMALTCLLSTEHGPTPASYFGSRDLYQVNEVNTQCPKLNLNGVTATVNNLQQYHDRVLNAIDLAIEALDGKVRNIKNEEEEHCRGDATRRQLQIDRQSAAISVYCESNKYGENWLLIGNMPANSSSHDSYNIYKNNKNGFGDLTNKQRAFFIGTQKLLTLTRNAPYELLIVLRQGNDVEHYVYFPQFAVQNANNHLGISDFISDVNLKSLSLANSKHSKSGVLYNAISIKSWKMYVKATQ